MSEQELIVARGLLQSAAISGVAALAVLALARFAIPPRKLSGPAVAAAFVVAYCLGHAIAAGSDFSLLPDRNWHWLFYLIPLAGLAGCLGTRPGAGWRQRCFLVAILALLTAGALTNRSGLWAPRGLLIAGIWAYLVVAWLILEPLAARLSPAPFAAAGWLSATVLAGLISEQISLTDGQIKASAAGALAAIAIVALSSRINASTPALAMPLLVTLGGWAWKELLTETRFWALLAVPLAPAALWLTRFGPLARRSPLAAMAVGFGAAFVVLVVAALIVRKLGGEISVY